MSAGKHARKTPLRRHIGVRGAAIVAALALVVAVGVGGTLAWLSDQTEPVVNTFTYGDISIDLTETDTGLDGDGNPSTNRYKMMPGASITKDPVVTVKRGSEDCWLFVKLDKSANFDEFLTYGMADGWTALEDGDPNDGVAIEGVFYRKVTAAEVAQADVPFAVIKDNTVFVKENVTKDMLNALDANPDEAAYPTLAVTAYAVQCSDELEAINSAYKAWVIANTSDAGSADQGGSASDASQGQASGGDGASGGTQG